MRSKIRCECQTFSFPEISCGYKRISVYFCKDFTYFTASYCFIISEKIWKFLVYSFENLMFLYFFRIYTLRKFLSVVFIQKLYRQYILNCCFTYLVLASTPVNDIYPPIITKAPPSFTYSFSSSHLLGTFIPLANT